MIIKKKQYKNNSVDTLRGFNVVIDDVVHCMTPYRRWNDVNLYRSN